MDTPSPETKEPQQTEQKRNLIRLGLTALVLACATLAGCSVINNTWGNPPSSQAEFMHGVTIDRIDRLGDTISAIEKLPARTTSRVVFDEGMQPEIYADAVSKLQAKTDVMGEVVDSLYVHEYSPEEYRARTEAYVAALGSGVKYWEIGNEINGEWLLNDGESRSVVAEKVAAAYDVVEQNMGKSAITLYYNEGCWERAEHEMFRWVRSELPPKIKNGVDYVFLSYYEDDCNGLQPNWDDVFKRLRQEFPSARLGFGEVGTKDNAKKEEYLRRYYAIKPNVDGFVGGHFWWYFVEDMARPAARGDTRMLDALSEAIEKNK